MNGWQRFGVLLLCCFAIMVLFPDYSRAGWGFIGLVIVGWSGVILIISLLTGMFALERVTWLNKVISWALFLGILYSLLWYFPQTNKVSPINRLKYGEYPTGRDISRGLKRLTFNFDFVRRNVNRDENYSNQETSKKKSAAKKAKIKPEEGTIEIIMEED